jgi:hypothetical protein
MKTARTRTRIATRKRTSRAGLALRRLERLEAGYREVQFRLDQPQKALDAALAEGRLSLADVDPDNLECVRRFEARRLHDAGRRLRQEMKSLTAAGVIDAKGRRVLQGDASGHARGQ